MFNKIGERSKQFPTRAAFENEVARLEQESFEIVCAVNETMDDFFHDFFLSLFVISLAFSKRSLFGEWRTLPRPRSQTREGSQSAAGSALLTILSHELDAHTLAH